MTFEPEKTKILKNLCNDQNGPSIFGGIVKFNSKTGFRKKV